MNHSFNECFTEWNYLTKLTYNKVSSSIEVEIEWSWCHHSSGDWVNHRPWRICQWSTEQKICSGSLLVFDIAHLHSRPVHCCCHCWVGKSPNPMPINHQSMLPVCGESKLLISWVMLILMILIFRCQFRYLDKPKTKEYYSLVKLSLCSPCKNQCYSMGQLLGNCEASMYSMLFSLSPLQYL